jgi:hypothetical protein
MVANHRCGGAKRGKIISLAFAASRASSAATAQVTRIEAANPAPKGQDLNRIVCEVDETTGTRLGARKICKTVLEWQDMRTQTRTNVEMVQRMATSTGCPNGVAVC